MNERVTVSVPATIANLGSGFDTLGVAVEMRNYVSIQKNDRFEVVENGRIVQGEDLVVKTIKDFFKFKGYTSNVKITKKSLIPPRKGLGSSSAAIVSALGAAMIFLNDFDEELLFEKAVELEGHPDNVAPAIYGGVRVSAKIADKNVSLDVKVPFEKVEVFIPPCEISTVKARMVLPHSVPFADAIFNIQRVAMLITSAFNGELSKEYFEDRLHQNKRLSLCKDVERFFEGIHSTLPNPVFLCGSGPSIAVIGKSEMEAPRGWKKMTLNVAKKGLEIEKEEE